MNLKWKVCGMKDAENIAQVVQLQPDYMGFIFYRKSPRFVGEQWEGPGNGFPRSTKKVGVFVNEPPGQVRLLAGQYQLDYLQLHGDETPGYCRDLFEDGYALIKAISLKREEDLEILAPYKPWIKYFLFDTGGENYGGTGTTFDWSLLQGYDNEVPLFLSGGISLENIKEVGKIEGLELRAIDVNSRFELVPGLKDPARLKELKDQIQKL